MKLIRLTIIFLFAGTFLFLANDLYQRQQNKFTFLSFQMDGEATSVVIPNIDRLIDKMGVAENEPVFSQNTDIVNGLNQLIQYKDANYNDELGTNCFLSFTETDFIVAFDNPDLDYDGLISFLETRFALTAVYGDARFKLNERTFITNQYGVYTVFSTKEIVPKASTIDYLETNADYIVVLDSAAIDRYILANQKEFKVWNELVGPVRGEAVDHSSLILNVPKTFDQLNYYGSKRLGEDKMTFFDAPEEEAFSWINNGLLVLKKGDFELLIAQPNDERDLKLILEEQTMAAQGDSAQLNFLTVKNVEIMPFESTFKWEQSIPELTQQLKYYAEFQDYNVLSNSFEAMRWYLSEIQTGSLLEEDEWLLQQYYESTPKSAHQVEITATENGISIGTHTWLEKNKCANTFAVISTGNGINESSEESIGLPIDFAPSHILPFNQKGKEFLLAANSSTLVMFDGEAEIWRKTLESSLVIAPQKIDLENDGSFEWALFLNNQFQVLSSKGENIGRFTRKLNEPLKGGLCANYDMNYDYRFFLVTGKSIICMNERGEDVAGWMYAGNQVPLTGASFYTQIAGKDYLCFKDDNNALIILNRRGENRFANQTASNLPNESDFVTGKDETVLHKLGYQNQYIYNRYIKDGYTDSIKLDKRVNAIEAEWIMLDEPKLLIEEPGRMMLFNAFGYVEQEILKPQNASTFLGIHAIPEIHYVFFNNSNNSLYLLNKDGKLILSNLLSNSTVYGINTAGFYSFYRQTIKEHKLN